MDSRAERTLCKAAAGGPKRARLQLEGKTAAHGPREVVDCGLGDSTFMGRYTERKNWRA